MRGPGFAGGLGHAWRRDPGPQPFTTRLAAAPTSIWCLGDSITRGNGSTTSYGWRKGLYLWTSGAGYAATQIGSANGPGDWPSPNHNGTPGHTIAQNAAVVSASYAAHNQVGVAHLVILGIGTNDCVSGYDGTATPAAYAALLEQIYVVDRAYILATDLPPSSDGTVNANILDFNSKLPAIWAAFAAKYPGRLYAHSSFTALGGVFTPSLMFDYLHPNDAGYAAMVSSKTNALSGPPVG